MFLLCAIRSAVPEAVQAFLAISAFDRQAFLSARAVVTRAPGAAYLGRMLNLACPEAAIAGVAHVLVRGEASLARRARRVPNIAADGAGAVVLAFHLPTLW